MATRAERALAALLLAVVLAVGGWPSVASAAGAVGAPSATTVSTPVVRGDELGNSLPKPNSGVAPRDAGDRGGAAQVALFGLLVAGTAFIGVMITREVRRGRRRLEARRGG